jgi:hypothetical protein
MRGWLLLPAAVLGVAGAAGGDFAARMPEVVTDVSSWELVAGEFMTSRLTGTYRFYVNPRYQGLYQLMRYRARFSSPRSEGERGYRATEKLVYYEHPGRREPLLCFENMAGIAEEAPHWRQMRPGDVEYILEMGMVMQVLAAQQQARTESRAPGDGADGARQPR